jgi:hypothetical protein
VEKIYIIITLKIVQVETPCGLEIRSEQVREKIGEDIHFFGCGLGILGHDAELYQFLVPFRRFLVCIGTFSCVYMFHSLRENFG